MCSLLLIRRVGFYLWIFVHSGILVYMKTLSLIYKSDWGQVCVYLLECSLLAGQAPSRCRPSWRGGLAGWKQHITVWKQSTHRGKKKEYCYKNQNLGNKQALTLCEDLEVFNRWGSRLLLIRNHCGQVLKNRRPCKTQSRNSVTYRGVYYRHICLSVCKYWLM